MILSLGKNKIILEASYDDKIVFIFKDQNTYITWLFIIGLVWKITEKLEEERM